MNDHATEEVPSLFFVSDRILKRITPLFAKRQSDDSSPNACADYHAVAVAISDVLSEGLPNHVFDHVASFDDRDSATADSGADPTAVLASQQVHSVCERLSSLFSSPAALVAFEIGCRRRLLGLASRVVLAASSADAAPPSFFSGRFPSDAFVEPFRVIIQSLRELGSVRGEAVDGVKSSAAEHFDHLHLHHYYRLLVAVSLSVESLVRAKITEKQVEGSGEVEKKTPAVAKPPTISIMLHENVHALFVEPFRETACPPAVTARDDTPTFLCLATLMWIVFSHSGGLHLRNMTLHGALLPMIGEVTADKGAQYCWSIRYMASMGMFALCELISFCCGEEEEEEKEAAKNDAEKSASVIVSAMMTDDVSNKTACAPALLPMLWQNFAASVSSFSAVDVVAASSFLEHCLRLSSPSENRTFDGKKFVGLDSLLKYDANLSARKSGDAPTASDVCLSLCCHSPVMHACHSVARHWLSAMADGKHHCQEQDEHPIATQIFDFLHGLLEAPLGPNLRDALVHFKHVHMALDVESSRTYNADDDRVTQTHVRVLYSVIDVLAALGSRTKPQRSDGMEIIAMLPQLSQHFSTVPFVLRKLRCVPQHCLGDTLCFANDPIASSAAPPDIIVTLSATAKRRGAAEMPFSAARVLSLDDLPPTVSIVQISENSVAAEDAAAVARVSGVAELVSCFAGLHASREVALSVLVRYVEGACCELESALAGSRIDQTICSGPASDIALLIHRLFSVRMLQVFDDNVRGLLSRYRDETARALRDPSKSDSKKAAWLWLMSGESWPPAELILKRFLPLTFEMIVHRCANREVGGVLKKTLAKKLAVAGDMVVRVFVPSPSKPSAHFRSVGHFSVAFVGVLVDTLQDFE